MDFIKERLMFLDGEIKNVKTEIEALYDTLDAEKDTSKVARLQARVQSLEAEEKELISGRNALFDKLQPEGMAEKIKKLLILAEKNNKLHMDNFLYTEGKISQHSSHFGDQSLEAEEKELISGRNALFDKLQPEDMAEDLKKLLILTEMNIKLQMDSFLYTEGKISQHSGRFGEKVKKVYKAQAGPNCWCLLTNGVLPKHTVIGAHLFKHEWKEHTDIIGIDDIDDTRNGLPLWKPIKWAFDTSRLCFTFEKETEEFVAHVLDPGIWDLRLVEKGKSLMGHKWKDPAAHLQSLTFKDLQGRSLQFDPQSLHRPFKRALNFQARQARKYAIRHRWQEASWDFEDFFTEGMDISEELEKWFGLS